MVKKLTTVEAAEKLGISRVRVFQLIRDEILSAEKVGRDWLITEKDLETVKNRKAGRPRKNPEKSVEETSKQKTGRPPKVKGKS